MLGMLADGYSGFSDLDLDLEINPGVRQKCDS
jgi:hypothetical protein